MIDVCRDLAPEDLKQGLTVSFDRQVTADDVDGFAQLSWDFNPLHTDENYAAGTQFSGRVVHGAFQVAMVSALIGMLLPGRRALVAGMNARFHEPLRIGDAVSVSGSLIAWNAPLRTGRVRVRILRTADDALVSETLVDILLHREGTAGREGPVSADATARRPVSGAARQTVLVTGAAGGLGRAIVEALSDDHDILAVTNRQSLAAHVELGQNVRELSLDMSSDGWEESLNATLADTPLRGIVHAAWPGMPKGGLIDAEPAVLQRQIQFATQTTIGLARLLRAHADRESSAASAMVVIGSTAGRHAPNIAVAGYSLAKSLLEDTVRLLAPELAGQGVAINILAPGLMATGINEGISDRQMLMEKARIPLGRLCEPADVANWTRQLLSGDLRFVSGQTIVMAGGQL